MPEFEFGAEDLALCERLAFAARIARAGAASGDRRIRRAGEGTEFLDFRSYVPGDDVRRIDWTVFARLRQPFVRVLQHETTAFVHLLVDVSRSMSPGAPHSKAAWACRIACLLGYAALNGGDRLSVGTFSDRLTPAETGLRGRNAVWRIVRALRAAPCIGTTDLPAAAQDFCRRTDRRGLVVLLSDFLTTGHEPAIRQLLASRFRVLAIQVLDREDWGETLSGSLRMRDRETGRLLDVTVSRRTLSDYQHRLRTHSENLRRFCQRLGQSAIYVGTRDAPGAAVVRGLRELGLMQ